jgi:hypothetical protein
MSVDYLFLTNCLPHPEAVINKNTWTWKEGLPTPIASPYVSPFQKFEKYAEVSANGISVYFVYSIKSANGITGIVFSKTTVARFLHIVLTLYHLLLDIHCYSVKNIVFRSSQNMPFGKYFKIISINFILLTQCKLRKQMPFDKLTTKWEKCSPFGGKKLLLYFCRYPWRVLISDLLSASTCTTFHSFSNYWALLKIIWEFLKFLQVIGSTIVVLYRKSAFSFLKVCSSFPCWKERKIYVKIAIDF